MIKVVRQHDIKDCGICCLSSIISHYDGYVPFSKLRIDAKINKEGTSAYHLIEALRKYHFEACGMKIDIKDLKTIPKPAIAHIHYDNGLNHFVVIESVNNRYVTLMDPAKGKVKLSLKKFAVNWTNIVILCYPNGEVPKLPKEKSILLIFQELLQKEKNLFYPILLFNLLIIIFSLILNFFYKYLLEFVTKSYYQYTFIFLISLYFLFNVVKFIMENLRDNIIITINKNIESKFIYAFLNHLFKLSIFEYSYRSRGELLARISEAKEALKSFIEIIITYVFNFSISIVACIFLLMINKYLAIFTLCGLFIYILYNLINSSKLYRLIAKVMASDADFQARLNDNLQVFVSMKNLNCTPYILNRLEQSTCEFYQNNYQVEEVLRKINFGKKILIESTLIGSSLYGMYLIGISRLNLYDFIFIESLITNFIEPLKKIIDVMPSFYYLRNLFSKISDFNGLREEEIGEVGEFKNGEIVLKNITYSYNGFNNNLENFNLKIKKGSHSLVLGPSGIGKSTICKILHQDISNYQGDITINKVNIKDYSLATIRSNITYLSQNESLINGTIKENILFGRVISEEDFWKVCDICQIEDIVSKRPFRYNEAIMVSANSLSGGEKQRIILARALLNKSEIYLLDECLSEVNIALEEKIIKKINTYLKKSTIIYISHKDVKKLFDEVINFAI